MSTILLVDSQPIIREALRALAARAGHEIAGEADNGQDALALCRELRPDVVILELAIPRLGGLDVLRRLRAAMAEVRLLVFSAQEGEVFAGRSLQAGADAFVSKSEPAAELEKALAAVLRGRSYFPRGATQLPKPAGAEQDGKAELERLSGRELTVLEMLGRGLSNKEISEQLSLSYKTVSTYKMRLHQKLNVSSDFQLLQVAQSLGLVASEAAQGAGVDPALVREMGLLRAVLDASPNPMFVRDLEGRLLLCNRPFLARAGMSLDEVLGTRFEEAQWLSPLMRQRAAARYQEVLLRQEPMTQEVVLDTLDETPKVYYAWCIPHRAADGRVIGTVGGMFSLAERDEQLALMRSEQYEAQYRNHLKTRLLARVRHEFGERLLGLRTYLAGISQGIGPVGPREELAQAWEGVEGMLTSLRQVDDLLDLEHHVAERVSEAHDLSQLTADILRPLERELESLGISLDMGPGLLTLKKAWVDAGYFRQLLEALVEGVPRSPELAEVRLHLSNWRHLKGFLRLRLEVSPWSSLAGGQESDEAVLWARARVQRMVLMFHGEALQLENDRGEGLLRLEFDLPRVV
ncbi:response regulator [Pseudomonas sp. LABIM340]|uniref:Response regulator n=1 Tax=Pseudomonas nitroreducens TaxID=46680 RepID=A0A5R8ZTM2_PSENT|nr:response regulator [Pseudomonas nitroreducens]TLP69702.1 response regulator [Pseudomonas nitroreducens]